MIEKFYSEDEIKSFKKDVDKLYNAIKKNKDIDKLEYKLDKEDCILNILVEYWKKIGVKYPSFIPES
ncbi:MAG: hypothetical protein ACTSRZ_11565 [Promethearchaeota archaeon]